MRILFASCAAGLVLAGLLALSDAQEYWGEYHAATAAESAARGMADVVRSAGEANLLNAEAAGYWEAARSQNIDNHLKYTKTYFEMKRANKEYRDATKAPRPTSEQLFRLAKDATPKSLTPDQLDPVTGKINWPEVLLTKEFSECRQTLDALYADRASASGRIKLDQYNQIRDTIKQAQDLLKGKLNELPPATFTGANAFLKQLQYAAKLTG
jgi:hypothetical protein